MAIFNSYVSLPEGNLIYQWAIFHGCVRENLQVQKEVIEQAPFTKNCGAAPDWERQKMFVHQMGLSGNGEIWPLKNKENAKQNGDQPVDILW